MQILQIVFFCLVAVILLQIIRQNTPEIAVQFSLLVGLVVFLFVIHYIGQIINLIWDLTLNAKINLFFLEILLKIIGISYIADFGAQVCKDAGEGTIAAKIEMAGKIFIFVLAVPIITMVLETLLNFLS